MPMPSTHPAARRRGPGADGFPGIAAICRAYGVNASLLGGGDADEAAATAEEAVELARRSGMPTAIVLTLNSLAMSLVERDPVRARAVLGESLVRTIGMGEDLWGGLLTACMVAGRLRDWSSRARWSLARCTSTAGLWLRSRSPSAWPSVRAPSPMTGPK
jgi:hypothetical protein